MSRHSHRNTLLGLEKSHQAILSKLEPRSRTDQTLILTNASGGPYVPQFCRRAQFSNDQVLSNENSNAKFLIELAFKSESC